MPEFTSILRSRRVVLPDAVRPADIAIAGEEIGAVADYGRLSAPDVRDFGDLVIMPGLVDTHVHINEPGRTDWEGFETATRAAAAGGVTTLFEMPLNSIPAVKNANALGEKIAAAQGRLSVDVGFWGGVVPGNSGELEPLVEAGAFGFKCFLVPSGVPEFEGVSEADLREAMPLLARLDVPLLAHAELPGPIERATAKLAGRDPRAYAAWLDSHPGEAEVEAIELLVRLAEEFGTRLHIVHLSAAAALSAIREAKSRGVRLTVETCPHYLTIAAEDVPDGATEYKCAPPIRERENQNALWEALRDGTIDFIATDHSPAPPTVKCRDTGDFMKAWGGIGSLGLALPLIWTEAKQRGFALDDVARWLCSRPAELARLSRKGNIIAGSDADFVVWSREETFTVEASRLHFRHKLTPYLGRTLSGVVQSTLLRGREIFANGSFHALTGTVLLRGVA
jgi:allantoinase